MMDYPYKSPGAVSGANLAIDYPTDEDPLLANYDSRLGFAHSQDVMYTQNAPDQIASGDTSAGGEVSGAWSRLAKSLDTIASFFLAFTPERMAERVKAHSTELIFFFVATLMLVAGVLTINVTGADTIGRAALKYGASKG